jgi:hypothetical protein
MKLKFDFPKIIEAVKSGIKRFLWNLGLNAFSVILLLILIDLILGGIVFYKYVFLAEQEQPNITGSILKFDDKIYKEVLQDLQPTTEQSNPPVQSQSNLAK